MLSLLKRIWKRRKRKSLAEMESLAKWHFVCFLCTSTKLHPHFYRPGRKRPYNEGAIFKTILN